MCLIKTELRKNVPICFFQRLQEIDDNLLKVVRGSSGRNPAGVEAEIRELEKELKIPGIALSSSKVLKSCFKTLKFLKTEKKSFISQSFFLFCFHLLKRID